MALSTAGCPSAAYLGMSRVKQVEEQGERQAPENRPQDLSPSSPHHNLFLYHERERETEGGVRGMHRQRERVRGTAGCNSIYRLRLEMGEPTGFESIGSFSQALFPFSRRRSREDKVWPLRKQRGTIRSHSLYGHAEILGLRVTHTRCARSRLSVQIYYVTVDRLIAQKDSTRRCSTKTCIATEGSLKSNECMLATTLF